MEPLSKLLVIAGPTASGKSDFAIALAQRHNGEIISADSRQVYRGMDIGTGKVPRDTLTPEQTDAAYISSGIRHHLIDIADPNEAYNISHFLHDAQAAITDIRARGKYPILCGGTHFWIQALLEGARLPAVPPNLALRESLRTKTPDTLFALLKKQDAVRAATIDRHNPARLIRALEIIAALGTVPRIPDNRELITENKSYTILVLNPPKDMLRARIKTRLATRFDAGMIDEVRQLHAQGVSWERLESFGLEYRCIAQFLQNKLDEAIMPTALEHAIWQYARRQLSWLRRLERQGTHLKWINAPDISLDSNL